MQKHYIHALPSTKISEFYAKKCNITYSVKYIYSRKKICSQHFARNIAHPVLFFRSPKKVQKKFTDLNLQMAHENGVERRN